MNETQLSRLELAVRKALSKLMTAYRKDIDDVQETVLVYLEALKDLEPLDIEGGASRAIRAEGRFFPNPGTLRSYALEERTARTVNIVPQKFASDVLCSLCGATRYWYRGIQVPAPEARFHPAHVIAKRPAHETSRAEVEHKLDCPIRRGDQPALILTRDAA